MADAKVIGSHVRGSADAIAATQMAPQHYYQRPDAEHLEFDDSRRSISGFDVTTVFGRLGGEHIRFAAGNYVRSPGFEVNDLGFQYGADNITNWGWAQYRDDETGKRLRSWQVNANSWTDRSFGLEHRNVGGNLNASMTFANLWSAGGGWGVNQNALETSRLRGGPALAGSPSTNGWLWASSDYRERVFGTVNGNTWLRPADDSWSANASFELGTQLRSNLRLSAGPHLSRRVDSLQFVGAYGAAPRYVLGRIDQKTAALTLRVDYTLTPALSVQLYAQPFVSSGSYGDFIEPRAPRASATSNRFAELDGSDLTMLESEGFSQPDFSFRQLHANTFLRWEYLPGSAAFLIWAHGRTSSASGAADFSSDARALAGQRGEHRVLLKLSYRWAP